MTTFKTGLLAISLTAACVFPAFAQEAPTKAQCDEWFASKDANKDGTLSGDELSTFAERLGTTMDVKDLTGYILQKATFDEACTAGKLGMPSGG